MKSSGPAEAAVDGENCGVEATAGTHPVEDEGPPADGVVVVDAGHLRQWWRWTPWLLAPWWKLLLVPCLSL